MSEHHDHSHVVVTEGNSKKLMFALGLTTTFLIVEVVAAFVIYKQLCDITNNYATSYSVILYPEL